MGMEAMDAPRRIGGLVWIGVGAVAELVWLILDGGRLGAVTAVLALVMFAAAAAFVLPIPPRVRWWCARLAGGLIGVDFCGAIADRFGLLGGPGQSGVSWGSWQGFVEYTATLVPWLGAPQVWAVATTAAEAVLGALLLAGCWWRWVGKATAGLLFVYTVSMSATVGLAAMLGYAVPLLLGGALLASARGARPVAALAAPRRAADRPGEPTAEVELLEKPGRPTSSRTKTTPTQVQPPPITCLIQPPANSAHPSAGSGGSRVGPPTQARADSPHRQPRSAAGPARPSWPPTR